MNQRLTVNKALASVAEVPEAFRLMFEHGTLEIEIYKPIEIDYQEPHTRDEIYVIAKGHGYFEHEGQRQQVEAGEVLFVPAGDRHRFEDFSDDFATWVFFYGPEGGEKPTQAEK